MEITLRKANALQTAITDVLKTIPLTTNISLNEFQDFSQVMATAKATLTANLTRVMALNTAVFELRTIVGAQNAVVGINERLAGVAYIEKDINVLNGLVNSAVALDDSVITGKLDKIRNSKDEGRSIYGQRDEVSTSVLSADNIAVFRNSIASQKKAISTKVPLTPQTVSTLTTENLL
jgi:hypothetical protein